MASILGELSIHSSARDERMVCRFCHCGRFDLGVHGVWLVVFFVDGSKCVVRISAVGSVGCGYFNFGRYALVNY